MDASHRDRRSFQALPLLCVAPPHLRAPFGRGSRIFGSPFPQGNSAPFCTISVHSKSFRIRTSKTPLPQLLYNPHLQTPLGSAGNKGLITPLESALTRNSPVSLLESALTKNIGGRGLLWLTRNRTKVSRTRVSWERFPCQWSACSLAGSSRKARDGFN